MRKQILFVGHDANRAGAQLFLLQVIRSFAQHYECSLLLLAGGDLVSAYEEICPVFQWQNPAKSWWRKSDTKSAQSLQGKQFDLIYLNTIAVAQVFPWLKAHVKGPFLSHLHELSYSQSLYSTPQDRAFLFENADGFIGCSDAVTQSIRPVISAQTPIFTVHSFIDNQSISARIRQRQTSVSKAALGISEATFLVGSCGHAEWRKGIDWFLSTAAQIESPDIHFLWIGFPDQGLLADQVNYDIQRLGLAQRVTLMPVTPYSVEWLAQLDLFLLTSREDPFPLVMLEAALAGVPILGFEQSGGCEEFVSHASGWVVPYGDCAAMSQKITELKASPQDIQRAGQKAKEAVEDVYQFDRSIKQLDTILIQWMNP